MATLALDLGTRMGYALRRNDGLVESGSLSFALKSKDGRGVRWVKFRRWLVDIKQTAPDLKLIIFEDVKRHIGTEASHCFGAFRALVELFGEHHAIEYRGIGVGTWKKRFTGNGAAKKDDVIAVCRQLGFKPQDDNEADALGILHVALNQCPVLTPSPAQKSRLAKSTPKFIAGEQPF